MSLRTCMDTKGRGCLRTLPQDDFPKRGLNRDGSVRRCLLCRPCQNEATREWAEENPEKMRGYRRRSYVTHREKVIAAVAEYQARNRDAVNARRRERAARKRRGG